MQGREVRVVKDPCIAMWGGDPVEFPAKIPRIQV